MPSFNKVFLMGKLQGDPELKQLSSRGNVCKFTLATTRSYTLQDGSPREETTYVDLDAYGPQAEAIAQSATEGKTMFIEGRLKLDQWEDNSGMKRSKLFVVAENFQFIGDVEGSGTPSHLNKAILMGNLTRDPDLRQFANSSYICKLSIAVSRVYNLQDGTRKEDVAFVDIDAFGRQAEVIAKYCSKGKPLLVEGRLRLDQWEDNTGNKRSKLCTVLEGFQFVGSRADSDHSATAFNNTQMGGQAAYASAPTHADSAPIEDDVPF